MICWYQPTEKQSKKVLIHLCDSNPKKTLCGKEITEKWILWNWHGEMITCKKCVNKV
jgi:hypothetical protein